jgi:hypothetical protein
MKRASRIVKWCLILAACGLGFLQFIRPARTNPMSDESRSIQARLHLTPEVGAILDRSCSDCHSNNTRWPWYSNVSPVSWFVIDHVNHGRKHLNFSDWERLNNRESQQMLGSMCKEVKAGYMPLDSYLKIHRDARLSAADVKTLCDWTQAETKRLSDKL